LELQVYKEAWNVQHETAVKSYKKCGVSKALHGTYDVFFEESESSDNSNSSDECDGKWRF
jgi:hypothetical protein